MKLVKTLNISSQLFGSHEYERFFTHYAGLPAFDLEKLREVYAGHVRKLEKYATGIGKSSPAFQQRKEEIKQALDKNIPITSVLSSTQYIRPLFNVWLSQPLGKHYLSRSFNTPGLLNHLDGLIEAFPKKKLGTLATVEACHVFIHCYTTLGNHCKTFGSFIARQLKNRASKEIAFCLDLYKKYSEYFFDSKSHIWLAHQAESQGLSLPEIAEKYSIAPVSELYKSVQNIFYIKRIQQLKPNEYHDILSEVQDKEIYDVPYDETLSLGHVVINILIDKLESASAEPEQLWKDTILHIAGDPRVPASHINFRLWWSLIGPHRTDLVRSWLSRFDMKLFLRIISDFSEKDPQMRAMFPLRKRLLEHIFDENKIFFARLFIGSRAERFLARSFNINNMPFYTKIKDDPTLTVFYYRIGQWHIIEGSHSFAMRIVNKIPKKSKINQYEKNIIRKELSSFIDENYREEFGNDGGYLKIPHQGNWIYSTIIEMQKREIVIRADKILSREEFVEFQEVFL